MSGCHVCGYPAGNHPFRHFFVGAAKPAPESPYVPLHCGIGDIEALGRDNAALGAQVDQLRAETLRLTAKSVVLEVNLRAALRHAKELRRVIQFTIDLSGPLEVRDVRIDPNMKTSAEDACRNFDAYLAERAKAAKGEA